MLQMRKQMLREVPHYCRLGASLSDAMNLGLTTRPSLLPYSASTLGIPDVALSHPLLSVIHWSTTTSTGEVVTSHVNQKPPGPIWRLWTNEPSKQTIQNLT